MKHDKVGSLAAAQPAKENRTPVRLISRDEQGKSGAFIHLLLDRQYPVFYEFSGNP